MDDATSFFERLPEPKSRPEPQEKKKRVPPGPPDWGLPAWSGPPAGYIGGQVCDVIMLGQSPLAAVWIEHVTVFPTGLLLSLEMQIAEPLGPSRHVMGRFPWAVTTADLEGPRPPFDVEPESADDYLRLGFTFADASTVATTNWADLNDQRGRDAEPTGPVIRPFGGTGGGQFQTNSQIWVWPPAPDGPITVHALWPVLELEEISVEISAEVHSNGRAAIRELWPGRFSK